MREPVSPLFAGLTQTNQAMELQITQEYTGQQRHLVYLAPMWKQVLDFDMRVGGSATPVKEIIAGKLPSPIGGMVGVSGVGREPGWARRWRWPIFMRSGGWRGIRVLHRERDRASEWTPLTYPDERLRRVDIQRVVDMLMQSLARLRKLHRPAGPANPHRHHWQPLRPRHRVVAKTTAGASGTAPITTASAWTARVATGTGFIGQYPPEVAKIYESAATTPDDLLLFFHHVPYTYKLHDGKTVIQYIYD